MFVIFGLIDAGVLMDINGTSAGGFARGANVRNPVSNRA